MVFSEKHCHINIHLAQGWDVRSNAFTFIIYQVCANLQPTKTHVASDDPTQ